MSKPTLPNTTKADLVDAATDATGFIPHDINAVLDAITTKIITSMTEGRRVEIRRFGTFNPVIRKGRIVRNLNSGADIEIPDRNIVKFRAGKDVFELLNP